MTFASEVILRTLMGRKRMHMGSYTNASGDTGGDIDTQLTHCDILLLVGYNAAVEANAPVVDEDFTGGPIDGSAITIVTDDERDGYWVAFGT